MSHQQRARPSHWRHLLARLASTVAAAIGLDFAEAGDVDTTTVEGTFTGNVTATDYKAGITITLNAISQTINTATRQADHSLVHYVIAAAVDINDTLTFAYDDDFGDYVDDESNPLGDIAETPATNYVGAHLYHDTADCSAWIGAT